MFFTSSVNSVNVYESMQNIEFMNIANSNSENAIDAYLEELDVLSTAIVTKVITVEDVKISDKIKNTAKSINNSNIVTGIKDFIRKIIGFLTNMVNKFIDAVKKLTSYNESWFNKNSYKLDNIPKNVINNMEIALIPYWKEEKRLTTANIPCASLIEASRKLRTNSALNTEDAIYQTFAPKLFQLNQRDVTGGAKTYFRGGTDTFESVRGSQCKKVIQSMRNYCSNYKTIGNIAKRDIDNIKKELQSLERETSEIQARESLMPFMLLENAFLDNTEFVTMEICGTSGNRLSLEMLGVATKSEPNNNDSGDKQQAPQRNDEEQKRFEAKKSNDLGINSREKLLVRMNIKIATAKLTIMEECYNSYIKTLRSIVSATEKYNSNPENHKKGIIRRAAKKIW